jgi:alpha-acetolactate decarboxylase
MANKWKIITKKHKIMTEQAKKLGNQPATGFEDSINNVFMGLTKREYFAGLALQGILAHAFIIDNRFRNVSLSKESVECADALLEELSKTEKS